MPSRAYPGAGDPAGATEGHPRHRQTGTGKTGPSPCRSSIGSAIRPGPRKGARVLILAPTRELANQIADSVIKYGGAMRPVVTTVFGGVPIPRQERILANGVDVLVATPGRLLDLIDRRALSLGQVEVLVLDEADQMLDLGFIHALRKIVPMLPKQRQTMFFSATMPPAIAELSRQFLSNPVKVAVTPQSTTVERVEQQVTFAEKRDNCRRCLRRHCRRSTSTRRSSSPAPSMAPTRSSASSPPPASRRRRSRATSRSRSASARSPLRAKSLKVLVATDIAARGIDVPGVSHVINYGLPNVPEQYVPHWPHRARRRDRPGNHDGEEGIRTSSG